MSATIKAILARLTKAQIRGSVIFYGVIELSKSDAEGILALNVGNRKASGIRVAEYRRMMENGEWQVTHQGVAIGSDGLLLDGQHRLLAFVSQKVIQQFPTLISIGWQAATKLVVDRGLARSDDAIYKIFRGTDVVRGVFPAIRAAMVRSYSIGARNCAERWSGPMLVKAFDYFQDRIVPIVEATRMPFSNATIRGLMLRATYHFPIEEVCKFGAMASAEFPEQKWETVAIALRNKILGNPIMRAGAGGAAREMLWSFGQTALLAYLSKESVSILRRTQRIAFPFPADVIIELESVGIKEV